MNLGEILDYKLSMPSRLIKIAVSGFADKAVAPRAKSVALAEMIPFTDKWVLLLPMCPCGQFDLSVDETQWSVHSHLPSSAATNTAGRFPWCSGASVFPSVRHGGTGGSTRSVGVLRGQTKSTLAGSEDSPRDLLGRAQPPVFGALGAWPCARSCRIINRRSHINRSGFSDNQSAAAGGARINKAFYL